MNTNPYEPVGPPQDELRHREVSDGQHSSVAAGDVVADGSPQLSVSQRAFHGAREGAAIGLTIALARLGIRLYSEGASDDLSAHIPEISVYFAVSILAPAYLFAVGQAVAGGYSGAFFGAAMFAAAGAYLGLVFGDSMGVAVSVFVVVIALGFLVGAPVGASIQRIFTRVALRS